MTAKSDSGASSHVQHTTWALLITALAASVWFISRAPRLSAPKPIDLLSIVPAGPELIVTADMEALGSAASALLHAGGEALVGLEPLCGFEPILGVHRAILAAPGAESSREADFALLAETNLEVEPVLRCAEAVIRKRGGTPIRSTLGGFSSVRDRDKPSGEVAMRADGLFVLSGGSYFREVLDRANGAWHEDEAAELRSRLHVAVRRKLGPSQLAVSLLVGPRLPLPFVQALGFAVNVRQDVRLSGYALCPSASDCAEAARLVRKIRDDAALQPQLSSLTLLDVQPQGHELEIRGRLARPQLGPLLKELLSP